MIGTASATMSQTPNMIEVNVYSDTITTVTVEHNGIFAPEELNFTIIDVTNGGMTNDLEGSLDGTTWNNQDDTLNKVSQTYDGSNYTTIWEFQIRDTAVSSDDAAQLNTLYKVYFKITDNAGNYDTLHASIDACNTYVNAVPEFPTIALPVAAILGLAFIFQRRREEE